MDRDMVLSNPVRVDLLDAREWTGGGYAASSYAFANTTSPSTDTYVDPQESTPFRSLYS